MESVGTLTHQIRAIVLTVTSVQAFHAEALILRQLTVRSRVDRRADALVTVEEIDTRAAV